MVSTVALCVTYNCNDAFIRFCVPQFIHTFSDAFMNCISPYGWCIHDQMRNWRNDAAGERQCYKSCSVNYCTTGYPVAQPLHYRVSHCAFGQCLSNRTYGCSTRSRLCNRTYWTWGWNIMITAVSFFFFNRKAFPHPLYLCHGFHNVGHCTALLTYATP